MIQKYFNEVVKFMKPQIAKHDNTLRRDTTVIPCKLEKILDMAISVANGNNILINNKDVDLEILKYKIILWDKENYIIEQKQELQKVYNDLSILQKQNKKNIEELLSIRVENGNRMEQFLGKA